MTGLATDFSKIRCGAEEVKYLEFRYLGLLPIFCCGFLCRDHHNDSELSANLSSNMSSNNLPSSPARQTPDSLLDSAIRHNSVDILRSAIDLLQHLSTDEVENFVQEALAATIYAGSAKLTEHLLKTESVNLSSISASSISAKPSVGLFEVLLAHGWDVNRADEKTPLLKGQRIIDHAISNEELTRWLVEHGARVDGGDEGNEVDPRPPPLLETCAAHGSVSTLRFLCAQGARPGRRMLHRAILRAAQVGADPESAMNGTFSSNDEYEPETELRVRESERMASYLVNELELDVNASEPDIPWHFGTPINHAAAQKDGAKVVRWLLGKGADPKKKGEVGMDAEAFAKAHLCNEVLEVLKQWREEKMKERAG